MYSIMLVEDEPPILEMIKDMISSANTGFEVVSSAYNGRDALKLLEKEIPDVIITDIKMPFVDGLELIKKVNEQYPGVICVILSGYNDFEYARSALRLRVYDYLLKPIQPDLLEHLLDRLLESLKKKSFEEEYSFINSLVNNEQVDQESNLSQSLPYQWYYVVLAYAGALSSYLYDCINPRRDFWNNIDMNDLTGRLIGKNRKAWILNSRYTNGKVFIIARDCENDNYIKSVCFLLMDQIKVGNMPVNIISGHGSPDVLNIPQIVNRLNNILSREIIFGKSNVFFKEEKSSYSPFISPDVDERIGRVSQISNYDVFRKSLKILVNEWEEGNFTQLAVQTMLNRLVNLFASNSVLALDKNLWVDANEIISSSNNYEELYQNICTVFKSLFDLQSEKSLYNLTAKELVDKIEKYLEANYTKNITYKVFNEMFGYNETYITNVFRNIKGISPSKYVTRLRIDKAKDIISKQPDILLKNVSDMVGYDDSLYFSRVFKDMTGLSPSEYVKNLLK